MGMGNNVGEHWFDFFLNYAVSILRGFRHLLIYSLLFFWYLSCLTILNL